MYIAKYLVCITQHKWMKSIAKGCRTKWNFSIHVFIIIKRKCHVWRIVTYLISWPRSSHTSLLFIIFSISLCEEFYDESWLYMFMMFIIYRSQAFLRCQMSFAFENDNVVWTTELQRLIERYIDDIYIEWFYIYLIQKLKWCINARGNFKEFDKANINTTQV